MSGQGGKDRLSRRDSTVKYTHVAIRPPKKILYARTNPVEGNFTLQREVMPSEGFCRGFCKFLNPPEGMFVLQRVLQRIVPNSKSSRVYEYPVEVIGQNAPTE